MEQNRQYRNKPTDTQTLDVYTKVTQWVGGELLRKGGQVDE